MEKWESEIIAKLSAALTDCDVRSYPERPNNYFLEHPVGEVLVRYDGTTFGEVDASAGYQEMNVRFEMILVFRNLRDNGGLYATMDEIRRALFLQRLTGSASGIEFEKEDLLGEDEGIWEMGLKLKFDALFFPQTQASQTPPPSNIAVTTNSSGCGG